ncbi:MAG: hypothetical protein IPL35_08150 [Sphingobacteriales bacterium]|nr:hypothetical protein [Sphingobacteriales bacterium]
MKTKYFLLRPRWLLLLAVWILTLFAPQPEARAQNAEFAPIGAKWTYLIPSHDMFENQDDIGWAITRSVGDTLKGKSVVSLKAITMLICTLKTAW